MRVITRILPLPAAIPCQDRYSGGEGLLVRDTLCFVLTKEHHRSTSTNESPELLLAVEAITKFSECETALRELLTNGRYELALVAIVFPSNLVVQQDIDVSLRARRGCPGLGIDTHRPCVHR